LDFVVVGLTLGALAVLAGVVLLGWESGRWQRSATRADSSAEAARFLAIAADRRSTGEALLYAGAAVILATVGALAGSLDDRTGAFFVVTTVTVAAAGILLRAYLHRSRHPIPATPRRVPRPVPPARPVDNEVSVLFSEPLRGAAETVEPDAVLVDRVDESADLNGNTSPAPPDDVIESEPVGVAATDRGNPDDEDYAENKVGGESTPGR
jgi:hypothetical protein